MVVPQDRVDRAQQLVRGRQGRPLVADASLEVAVVAVELRAAGGARSEGALREGGPQGRVPRTDAAGAALAGTLVVARPDRPPKPRGWPRPGKLSSARSPRVPVIGCRAVSRRWLPRQNSVGYESCWADVGVYLTFRGWRQASFAQTRFRRQSSASRFLRRKRDGPLKVLWSSWARDWGSRSSVPERICT